MLKVLQICPKPPLPEIDGGCKAMHAITSGLLYNGVQVKVLTMSTFKHPFDKNKLPEDYKKSTQIEAVDIDIKIKPKDAFLNLFSGKSYNIERFINNHFAEKLKSVLSQQVFDIVLLEGLYVTPYIEIIRKYSQAKIIYREHNIEYLIWERKSKTEQNPLKRKYLAVLSQRLKNYEIKTLQTVDGIAAITPVDLDILKKIAPSVPIAFIPFGLTIKNNKILLPENFSGLKLFHIGAMDWFPNHEGIMWFLKNVWPQLHHKFPDFTLHLAGRAMTTELLNFKAKNVFIYGEVADAYNFMKQNDVMISPLFVGSGMRIKIIEAMTMAKPVVATPTAAEGILYENEKNMLIADNKTDFINQIEKLTQPDTYKALARKGMELVNETYHSEEISKNLLNFMRSIA